MKKILKSVACIMGVCMMVTSLWVPTLKAQEKINLQVAEELYLKEIDLDYAYQLAKKLETHKSNKALGYRTAGSKAEIETGNMLVKEMEAIGLSDIHKDEFTLDTWEFEKAQLSFTNSKGQVHNFELGGYQTQFDTKGPRRFEVVYGGRGTAADLEGLDVKDKLVLIDINQRDEWWINYPTYQAHLKGAAAVIAVQAGGYGEVHSDALNAQDICGPADAPAFSMSQTDANLLKEALKISKTGSIEVTFDAKSIVGFDGKSYNIVGTIPGKDPNSMILMSAHYDSYFAGFQDDNAAVALMMSIAKAIKESGYTPEKTLVFCAMAAEEWGTSNTRYDWSTGAYNQIFKVHPEWVGKVVANINFELPAYAHGDTDDIRSVYEYKTFLEDFISGVPKVEGAYQKGIQVITPIQSWSDDFSMSIAGVPAIRNDFSGTFMEERYHSQFDDETTYDEKAFLFHHQLYGMLLMAYDQTAVVPLDFTTRLSALKETVDEEVMIRHDVDYAELFKAIDETKITAQKAWEKVNKLNVAYKIALEQKDAKQAKALKEEADKINDKLFTLFKYAQDKLVRLTWEDAAIFPHEHAQNNLVNLDGALEALKEGAVQVALDEYLFGVDNNWYAYDFDEATFSYFTNYVLEQQADRLMWGAGRVMGHENLLTVIKSLQTKYDDKKPQVQKEAVEVEKAIRNQEKLLKNSVSEEVKIIQEMNRQLKEIVN